MKRMLLAIAAFASSTLVGLTVPKASAAPLALPTPDLQTITSALAFPTSSERFFREGQQPLEREIQALQQDPAVQAIDILEVDPAISQQLQELEQHLFNGVPRPDSDSSLSNPIR